MNVIGRSRSGWPTEEKSGGGEIFHAQREKASGIKGVRASTNFVAIAITVIVGILFVGASFSIIDEPVLVEIFDSIPQAVHIGVHQISAINCEVDEKGVVYEGAEVIIGLSILNSRPKGRPERPKLTPAGIERSGHLAGEFE